MKQRIIFGIAAAVIFLCSCKKDALETSLLAKWSVVADSSFAGVGINNHPVNHKGQRGDYFDFRADSDLYINEGGKLDTLHYKMTSDTTLLIDGFGVTLNGVPETCVITHLTTHTLTITAPNIITPAGFFGGKVELKK